MARRRLSSSSSDTSPSKSRGVQQKGYRHFSCKHYKLVASKYPFLQAVQIKGRVKKLWNQLPQNKKEEYAHSPENIESPSPKKFTFKCRLSPDLYSPSPTKAQNAINRLTNTTIERRPLKTSWKTYLDTSHKSHDEVINSDNHSLANKHTGILVNHSEDKQKKPKSKKPRVTFELYPRKELFATDGAPVDISLGLDNKSDHKEPSGEVTNSKHPSSNVNVQYLDGVLSELGGIAAEICVSTSDQVEVEQVVNGVLQDKINKEDVICRETGEVEIVAAVLDESCKIGRGGGKTRLDEINHGEVDVEQQIVVEAVGQSNSIEGAQEIQMNGHLNEANSGCGEQNASGFEKGSVDQKIDDIGVNKHTIQEHTSTNQVTSSSGSCPNHHNMCMETESCVGTDGHHQAIAEGMSCPVETTKPITTSPPDIDEESCVVAQILTELGIMIAQEVSPEGRQKRNLLQQEEPRNSQAESLVNVSPLSKQTQDEGNCESLKTPEENLERDTPLDVVETNTSTESVDKHEELANNTTEESAIVSSTSGKELESVDIAGATCADLDTAIPADGDLVSQSKPLDGALVSQVQKIKRGRGRPRKKDLLPNKSAMVNLSASLPESQDKISVSGGADIKRGSGRLGKKNKTGKICETYLRRSPRLNPGYDAQIQEELKSPSISDEDTIKCILKQNVPRVVLSRSPKQHIPPVSNPCDDPVPDGSDTERRLRRSPRLASLLKNAKTTSSHVEVTTTSKQSPKKRAAKTVEPSPQTPPACQKPDKFAAPKFKVYEFEEEPQKNQYSSPKPRFTSPTSLSSIVPRCPSSDEDDELDRDKSSQSTQSTPSPGWIDSTAKRLIEKGMLSKKYKTKRAREAYDLDSNKNACDFADDAERHKKPPKRKLKARNRGPTKYVRKKKQDMFRKKPGSLPQPKRKNTGKSKKSKEQAMSAAPRQRCNGKIKSTNPSNPQEQEDELMQAILGITDGLDMDTCVTSTPIPECLQDKNIYDEDDSFFEDGINLSPVSMINDSCDNWMYYDHGNPDLESSGDDDSDNYFSPRKKRSGAICGPIPLSASQNLCRKFTEFCANLSQESSSQMTDIDDIEAGLEPTLNAVTLSPLYSLEESEGCPADLPDINLSNIDSEEEPQVESAALCAVRDTLTFAMGCLGETASMEDRHQGVAHDEVLLTQLEQNTLPDFNSGDQQFSGNMTNEQNREAISSQQDIECLTNVFDTVVEQQQQQTCQSVDAVGETSVNSQNAGDEDNVLKDISDEGNSGIQEQTDCIQEDRKAGGDDKELCDIIEEALKISGISEDSEYAATSGAPVTMLTDVSMQDDAPSDGGGVAAEDENNNILCNMFNEVTPPRVNHLPTPRSSGRRLLVSNRVETNNNFSQLFEEDDIFL